MIVPPTALTHRAGAAYAALECLSSIQWEGIVKAASGLSSDVLGLTHQLSLGNRLQLHSRNGIRTTAEIIKTFSNYIQSMSFSSVEGIGTGISVSSVFDEDSPTLTVSFPWLGRIVDAFGRPLDSGPPLERGSQARRVRVAPPAATLRARLGERMSIGVRAVDLFVTCRQGQRIGLFAGSGVGKSSLLAMLARNADCDVAVIALIGERGREVREFIEDELGESGLAKSIVVVATSDSSPLMRREAAYSAMTIAEHFRDCGRNVLFIMDSVTRFCQALREIALVAGEPPASRGYPPSVFGELPRLLERAGPGLQGAMPQGQITAFFAVLVEGDDYNEPVADGARGFLDGHIILDRRISEQGRFPAIDVLRSISRAGINCNSPAEHQLTLEARLLMSTYNDAAELVRIGAYKAGSDAFFDRALAVAPKIESVIRQDRKEKSKFSDSFEKLRTALR
jgi:flagellum-specific ATP synthase